MQAYIRFAYLKIGVTRRTRAVVWGVLNGLSTTPLTVAAATTESE